MSERIYTFAGFCDGCKRGFLNVKEVIRKANGLRPVGSTMGICRECDEKGVKL